MKSDASELSEVPKKTASYEQILGAIGQLLEVLCVRAFDLELDGNKYIVRGESEKPKKEIILEVKGFKNAFQKFRHNSKVLSLTQSPRAKLSSSFVFSGLQFTQEDIDRFERQQHSSKSDSEVSPSPHSLSQILWTLGAHLDHKRGRLLGISSRNTQVTLRYRHPLGGEQIEEFTLSNLYDLWVHMYKQRKQPIGMRRNGTNHSGV